MAVLSAILASCLHSTYVHPNGSLSQAHYDLKIPKEHHRFIIGREGAKLHSIELSTATKISVPRSDDSSEVVKIVGTKEGVDKARHQIQVISDEQVKYMCVVPYGMGPI